MGHSARSIKAAALRVLIGEQKYPDIPSARYPKRKEKSMNINLDFVSSLGVGETFRRIELAQFYHPAIGRESQPDHSFSAPSSS